MLFKRIISLILTLSMLIFGVAVVEAQDMPKLSDKVEEAHTVLSYIGFVSSDFSKDMVAEMGDVTRGEFAELIHQSYAKGLTSENVYFHDVPRTHYASEAISVLVERGAVALNEEKRFEPDRAITLTEAAKIILYIMGYENLINIRGSYPIGVNKLANDLDLYDGLSNSQMLSYGDALVLLYNGLLCEYVGISSIQGSGLVYKSSGESYGEKYYGLKENKGLVTGCEGTSIYGEQVNEDVLVIDRVEINAEGYDLSDYLGHKVKYVTCEIDDEEFLVYIRIDDNQEYIELNCIDNEFEFVNDSFRFYDSNKTREKKLEQNFTVIYNGAYLGSGITSALKEELYSVKLIQTDNSGYNLVIATSYESAILSAVDIAGEKLYIKTGGLNGVYKTIDLDLYENVYLLDASGAVLSIEELSKGNVLNIFETKDRSRIKIVISNDSFSGNIDSITDEDERACYTINGNDFYVYNKDIKMQYVAGQEVIVYLDVHGLIVDMSSLDKSATFAFVKRIAPDDGLEERTYLKVFNESGEFITLSTADKVNIDGKRFKASEVYDELGGRNFTPQLIAYETNEQGEIRHIDTAVKNDKDVVKAKNNMLVIEAEGSEQYDSHSNKLGKRMRVNSDTLLFGIPASPKNADEDLFGVTSATSKLVNQDNYDYILYSYGAEQKAAADAIVVSGMYVGGTSLLSDNFIVTDLKMGLNSDDEVVAIVEGYHGANLKSYTFTKEISEQLLSEVHEGDVLALGDMIGNDISKYSINLCPHEDTQDGKYKKPLVHSSGINSAYSFVKAQNASLQTWAVRYITGYVSDVVGDSIMVKYDRTNADTTPVDYDVSTAAEWDELFITQDEPVMVINVDKGNTNRTVVEKGSIADIKSFKATGEDCSRIFIYINKGDVRNFVIY